MMCERNVFFEMEIMLHCKEEFFLLGLGFRFYLFRVVERRIVSRFFEIFVRIITIRNNVFANRCEKEEVDGWVIQQLTTNYFDSVEDYSEICLCL